MNDWQTRVGKLSTNQNTHSVHVIYLRGASQNGERKVKMKVRPILNLSKRFTIARLCGTFHAYKDTKNKQNKMEELADKLGFVQIFLFLHFFLFLPFSSSVSLC